MTSRLCVLVLLPVALYACNDPAASGADGGMSSDGGGGPADMTVLPPDMTQLTLTVNGATNVLQLDTCAVTQASIANVAAGTYSISLDASTLSKGSVTTTPPQPSVDNYVIVQLPLPAGDPQEARRFFMLNGIGAYAPFTLPAQGNVQVMFIDSDSDSDTGQATVTVNPGALQTTVDAVGNAVRWRQACNSTAAQIALPLGTHTIKLVASTLSLGAGSPADYVLVRLPSEKPADDHRYIILNGVGASYTFDANDSTPLHAWLISPTTGATGQATLAIDPQ